MTEVRISDEQRAELAELYKDSRYNTLLDVMERACIEVETAHLNTSPGQPEEILGGHAIAKACWGFFIYVQKQIVSAYNGRVSDNDGPITPPTLDEFLQGVE